MNTQNIMGATTDSEAAESQATGTQAAMANFRGRGMVKQQSFFSMYKWYIVVLVVLIVVGITYWKYRKEKSINPNLKIKDFLKNINIKKIFERKKKLKKDETK